MTNAFDLIVATLIVLGGAFALIGSWGLARLPSLMSRLHGPTKATTLGVGGCLLASMIYFPSHGLGWSAHELLITIFLVITAPISANMIAKAHLHCRHCQVGGQDPEKFEPPLPPSGEAGWATFGTDEAGTR